MEQLPSGSYRVEVYAGTDPITKKRIRLRKTVKTEVEAQIALGKLLEQAMAGKEPESGATVNQLLDQYVPIADWDLSTRVGFEGYIRRTIRPALGHQKVRKAGGPLPDTRPPPRLRGASAHGPDHAERPAPALGRNALAEMRSGTRAVLPVGQQAAGCGIHDGDVTAPGVVRGRPR